MKIRGWFVTECYIDKQVPVLSEIQILYNSVFCTAILSI